MQHFTCTNRSLMRTSRVFTVLLCALATVTFTVAAADTARTPPAPAAGGKDNKRREAGVKSHRKAPAELKPLCDMSADDRYEGEDGGLYGGGTNDPPVALKKSAAAALANIRPLDADGKPAADGKIV